MHELMNIGGNPANGEDEYLLDTEPVRALVARMREVVRMTASPLAACEAIRPNFARLLDEHDWLPDEFQAPAPESRMGGAIGQWLLFRSGDRSLSLFSLVVPAAAQTPVHDHLAWGLVGLYRGTQDEEVFGHEHGILRLRERRALSPGDFYVLIPPRDDIHRVRTTSPETSVSLHLLANDTGCVWRHRYEPDSRSVRPFKSGYVNRECDPEPQAAE